MIELGGNIKLENFENIDRGVLVIVKKIVGGYTKQISEKNKDFKEIAVTKGDGNDVLQVDQSIVCVGHRGLPGDTRAGGQQLGRCW